MLSQIDPRCHPYTIRVAVFLARASPNRFLKTKRREEKRRQRRKGRKRGKVEEAPPANRPPECPSAGRAYELAHLLLAARGPSAFPGRCLIWERLSSFEAPEMDHLWWRISHQRTSFLVNGMWMDECVLIWLITAAYSMTNQIELLIELEASKVLTRFANKQQKFAMY